MKKIFLMIAILIAMNLSLSAQVLFNLGLEEGAYYSDSDFNYLNNIVSDLAYIVPITDNQSIIGYYQLKYTGPALGNAVQISLQERYEDNYFMLKYLWKVTDELSLKPSVSYLIEFDKFSSSEQWGQGLYDYNKWEGGLEVTYTPVPELPLDAFVKYQSFKYPNYTDLLTLYLTGFKQQQPLEDYKNINVSVSLNKSTLFNPLIISFAYLLNVSTYDQNKVVTDPAGDQSGANQNGLDQIFTLVPQYQLNENILFSLSAAIEINHSNQNFLTIGQTIGSNLFFSDYYNYTQISLIPSITYSFKKDHTLTLSLAYYDLKYSSRPPQISDGSYDTGATTYLDSLSIGLIYSVALSKYCTFSPMYMYIHATSNNTAPGVYNDVYDAQLITLKFNFKY